MVDLLAHLRQRGGARLRTFTEFDQGRLSRSRSAHVHTRGLTGVHINHLVLPHHVRAPHTCILLRICVRVSICVCISICVCGLLIGGWRVRLRALAWHLPPTKAARLQVILLATPAAPPRPLLHRGPLRGFLANQTTGQMYPPHPYRTPWGTRVLGQGYRSLLCSKILTLPMPHLRVPAQLAKRPPCAPIPAPIPRARASRGLQRVPVHAGGGYAPGHDVLIVLALQATGTCTSTTAQSPP
mmetsp:Transcript_35646/g.78465  ORF Transcript_35646/g.78465 Transcript_35646/m.78465 type:complete len:241 (+) Transcript_35646:758-1480(+)